MKKYIVKKVNLDLEKDNDQIVEDSLSMVVPIDDFSSPWVTQEVENITFSAICTNTDFYFKFKVLDDSVYIDRTNNLKVNVGNSDRVELFFRTDESLDPYYCLEIDATGRLMDFKARPDQNFDFSWNWPANEIAIKSRVEKDYFEVAGKISLKSLSDLCLITNNVMQVGVFRAKYIEKEAHEWEPIWITWVDPQTPEPNFHISNSFGQFIIE